MKPPKAIRRLLARAGVRCGHWIVRALGSTWRVRHAGRQGVESARRDGRGVLFCFTHGVLLPLAYTHRRRDIQVLISESRDGEIIARIVENLGFGTVRGSSSRSGLRAIAGLVARGREGRDLAVTPDGPRGPRGSVEPGAVIVAAKSGLPLVPVGVAAPRAWRARSWDRFLVPKPFASVWVVYGPPIRVPPAAIAHAGDVSLQLQQAIADAEARAEACAAGETAGVDVSGVPA